MLGKVDGKREMYYYNMYETYEQAKKVANWHKRKGRHYKIKRRNEYFELWVSKFIKLPWVSRW